ncbi:MAG: anti-sigma factor antagonist [Acidimicrobiales bacterium]|nr:anti-sigma factor antagonist [Acidimicrobiales bacterium]
MPELVLETEQTTDPPTVRVAGEIDLSNGSLLSDALDRAFDAGASSLCLDLSEVTYMDSTGLGILAVATNRAVGGGGTITVVGASALIRRLLKVSQLDTVMEVA